MCMCIVQIKVHAFVRLLSCAAMWSPWPSLLLYRQCAAVTTQWHFFRVRKWGLQCTHLSLTSSLHTKHHFNLVLFGPCPLTVCGKHLVSLKHLLSCVLKSMHFHGCVVYRIAGNFRGRNFHEFQGFVAIRKSFLHKMCGA